MLKNTTHSSLEDLLQKDEEDQALRCVFFNGNGDFTMAEKL